MPRFSRTGHLFFLKNLSNNHSSQNMRNRKQNYPERVANKAAILIILDGWGIWKEKRGNPLFKAKTPNFDNYFTHFPHTTLYAHGKWVGLPEEQAGNSEAGHMNIGAGKVIIQDAVRISEKIKNREFFKNPVFLEAIKHAKKNNSKLHLIGLLSGKHSPHSSEDHIYALMELARKKNLKKVILHFFTDGRDSSPHAAPKFLKRIREHFKNHNISFKIGSIIGRVYAMDRKKKWKNIEKAYNLLTLGEGDKVESAEEAISRAYNKNITDEFIPASIILKNEKLPELVDNNDSIIFFNLRSDRARELSKAFVQPNFNTLNSGSFKRKKVLKNIKLVAMTDFGPDLPGILTAYPAKKLEKTLPFVLKDFKQLYIAETEKYAHITFFINGGYAKPVAGEERIRIDSPKTDHYDEKPEMNLGKLVEVLTKKLERKEYNFICTNFANPDMIAHTGNFEAAVKCIEIVDSFLGKLAKTALKSGYLPIITADHGNIEEMLDIETGEINTNHSKNPVPFVVLDKKCEILKSKEWSLCNIAPTVLKLMGIKKPNEMTAESIV